MPNAATTRADMPAAATGTAPVVAAVIPCFREKDHVLGVLAGIGPEVRHILVVDDACPIGTGKHVQTECRDPRVEVVFHEINKGVGGATLTGYAHAIAKGADIIVKLDGDGQMDPALIPALVHPIAVGEADYAKGNRFDDLAGLKTMPAVRLVGNLFLSFASKMSSGYWNVFDPTNGFTAIHAKVARLLPSDRIDTGYFFESDMLFHLNLLRAVVADVPMRARYGNEQSSLSVSRALWEFAAKHLCNAAKRIGCTYFLRDFGIASIELVLGKALFLFGVAFGIVKWIESDRTGVPQGAGTVMLAALPVIVGTQLLLQFLNFDIRNVPRQPLHPRL